jgi:hypothetical protein
MTYRGADYWDAKRKNDRADDVWFNDNLPLARKILSGSEGHAFTDRCIRLRECGSFSWEDARDFVRAIEKEWKK